MKKSKKIFKKSLITFLCTVMIFTGCFNSYKVKVHATAVVGTIAGYTLYELCLYVGVLVATSIGVGYTYENRDEIAELGKGFIDSVDTDSITGWLVGTNTIAGNYVYGTEALEEIQGTSFEVLQGGGNNQEPEPEDENYDDKILGMWGTTVLVNIIDTYLKPAVQNWSNGEENYLYDTFGGCAINSVFNGWNIDSTGKYHFDCTYIRTDQVLTATDTQMKSQTIDVVQEQGYTNPICLINTTNEDCVGYNRYYTYEYLANSQTLEIKNMLCNTYYTLMNGDNVENSSMQNLQFCMGNEVIINNSIRRWYTVTNMPVFNSETQALEAFRTGNYNGCDNFMKCYRIADWLADDEYWAGTLEDLATSLRSLQDLTAIAQALAAGALASAPSANAFADMLNNLLSQYPALTNPITNPVYVPGNSPVPHIDPGDLPNPQPSNPTPTPTPEPETEETEPGDEDEEGFPRETGGLLSLFNALLYLILILIMLLIIFISCLAFIVMIFRIPAQTGFLPPEMVQGLDYLKTLQIPGFGMSVYGFFMALVYIILLFTVVGLLRKNIDKIRIPRKRGK